MSAETAIIVFDGITEPATSGPIRTAGKGVTFVHVYSAGSSVATVKVQASVDGVGRKTIKTFTNPDGEGELWELPPYPFIFLAATELSDGEIHAAVEVW